MKTQVSIINLLRPIPASTYSHEFGYGLMWKQRIEYLRTKDIAKEVCHVNLIQRHTTYLLEPLEDHQSIVVCLHGAHFNGKINVIGGLTPGLKQYVSRVMKAMISPHKLYHQWNTTQKELLKAYQDGFIYRLEGSRRPEDEFLRRMIHSTVRHCKPMFLKSLLPTHKLIVGDSHSFAFSDIDYNINYKNGVTLHRILDKGLIHFIDKINEDPELDVIRLCFGSIDMRFHLDHFDPKKLALEYVEQIKQAQEYFGMIIEVCMPVPIEHEARIIPKSGQLNGNSFVRARWQRLQATREFIDTMHNGLNSKQIIMVPSYWYDMDGREYAETIMERPRSVHIAPEHYKSVRGW